MPLPQSTKKGNIKNEYNRLAEQIAQETGKSVCRVLDELFKAESDSVERQKIKKAQKAADCRRHRG